MKRIIAVIVLALMISALSAASALASAVSPGVWAPNNGGGQSGNHAPDQRLITCIPGNQGTVTAEGHSPAIALCILD